MNSARHIQEKKKTENTLQCQNVDVDLYPNRSIHTHTTPSSYSGKEFLLGQMETHLKEAG